MGGLEIQYIILYTLLAVNHRTGGLEVDCKDPVTGGQVHHRIGGLEVTFTLQK